MDNLITLEEYKDSQGLVGSKEDARLELLITSVSQLVKTYCGRTFIDYYTEDKVELFNITYETPYIELSEFPLILVTSVEERDSYQSAYTVRTENAFEFYTDTETDNIIKTNPAGAYLNWCRGPGAVRVTYNGGYNATPEDLKLAVYDLITYYHKNEHKESKTIAGSTISNKQSTSQNNSATFPDHIKRVLDLYRVKL